MGLDLRFAETEAIDTLVGDGCHRERGQRIVQRHLEAGLARRIQRHLRFPQQQRVEQLPGRQTTTTATGGHGLAAIVTFALHLQGRGGGMHA